jgi:uncharacterized hydrophobic protein (TIGR00271 family)
VLHLRVISPPEHTEKVIAGLSEHPGITHLVVFRGAALQPEGDMIEADVAREAADEVIGLLLGFGVDHSGGITLGPLDTVLSDAADKAEEEAPGDAADAVVWEELLARTDEESRLNGAFLAFLSIACLLAAVGVITNSPVTIVGAMVLGPEFGPLAAFSVGLVRRRWDLVRRASLALAVGFPFAMAVTGLGMFVGNALGLFDTSVLAGTHEVDFVYEVGPWSLIVAVLAGAAGMLAMTSAKSAALVGVFISVTTVPAAGYASVAAILGEWSRFGESARQLGVNLLGVVLAATVVLLLRHSTWASRDVERPLSTG